VLLFEAMLETTTPPGGLRLMNKTELIAAVSLNSGLAAPEVRRVLDAVLDTVSSALREGAEVRLVGFGTFSRLYRPAGLARNPRTGEAVRRPAMHTARFRAGDSLKRSLN
jgi:DNA-binding protein HU-beta